MTAPVRRPSRRVSHLLFGMRWGGGLVAAAALTALCLPAAAHADSTGYDQMTGVGATASAVTVAWTQGLLDDGNNPIASANADRSSSTPTSPLSFMYKDFQNLKITVSQTQDIGHQGITVSWTGAKPTVQFGQVQADFLQMMECYGDSSSGPSPEQCEYGSLGLLPPGSTTPVIAERTGPLCTAGAVPSVTSPPGNQDGGSAVNGCDTQEPSDSTHLAPCPGTSCAPGEFTIPFAPVSDPTTLDYAADTTYYSKFNTNEVQEAVTAPDGTGQQQFETLTGTQAPGLGCGLTESSGQARGCWLVIVPRGEYEPNGFHINVNSANSSINTSPLSTSNWAQRIQIHLGYAPVQAFCPLGTLERQTVGTQLVARAMQSWQIALNQAANCSKIYSYSAVPEATSTQQLSTATSGGAGLAFTTIPIGSEATREPGGTAPTGLPTILYAPVAISALDFGFNINLGSGYLSTPIKLTPELLAKALSQSYKTDLPDYYPTVIGDNGPSWVQGNPLNIASDPQFQALNPEVGPDPAGLPLAPLITEDHSALNQQVWQWIQADSAASGWLNGTKGAGDTSVTIDPAYPPLSLGTGTAADSYPRAYQTCLTLNVTPGAPTPKNESKCSLDLLPYTDNFDSAGAAVLAANSPDGGNWDPNAVAADGSSGWWGKTGIEPLGQIFMWAADDTSNLAAYGLIPAQLCDDAGSTCVSPSISTVTAAVTDATADSSGLLQVNPAQPGTGAYPLVDVTYAAVATNQDPTALNDYADLIAYAAGSGQTTGSAAGNLPPGYLPLPTSLQNQAQAVVTQLRGLASASPSPSVSPTTGDTTSSGPLPGGGATTSVPTTSGAPVSTTGGPVPSTAAGATPSAASGAAPRPTPAATPGSIAPIALGSIPAPSASCSPSSSRSPGPSPASSCSPARPASGSITPGGPVTSQPPNTLISSKTGQQPVGPVRWALIGVLAAGGACASGGTVLRSGQIPPWLRRRRLD